MFSTFEPQNKCTAAQLIRVPLVLCLLVSLSSLLGCASIPKNNIPIVSMSVVEKSYALNDFDKAVFTTGGMITLSSSQNSMLVISGEENDINKIKFHHKDNKLIINCALECPSSKVSISLSTKTFSSVTMHNGGHIVFDNSFAPASSFSVSILNGGSVDATRFPVSEGSVKITNGGTVQLQVKDILYTEIRNGGTVGYIGNPTIVKNENSGGEIRQIDTLLERSTMKDSRDGRTYSVLRVGRDTWMTENLAYLPKVCDKRDGPLCGIWIYGLENVDLDTARESKHYQQYGALYNWAQARVICPTGWRLPTDTEWFRLEYYLGVSTAKLSEGIWRPMDPSAALISFDKASFNMSFPGWRTGYGKFNHTKFHANYWVRDESDEKHAFERLFGKGNIKVGRHTGIKQCGFSVRCVK